MVFLLMCHSYSIQSRDNYSLQHQWKNSVIPSLSLVFLFCRHFSSLFRRVLQGQAALYLMHASHDISVSHV